jgi:hypothetical protein
LTALEDQALEHELGSSRAVCEQRLGRPCLSIAYPYGDVDDRVARAARAAGYAAGAALPARLRGRRPMMWPRVGVYRPDTRRRFALKVSPAARRLRTWRPVAAVLAGQRSLKRDGVALRRDS